MKVLITTDWYKPVINGVVTSVLNLEKYLIAHGHEVRVLTLSQTVHSHKEGNVYYLRSINANKIYPNARMIYSVITKYVRELVEWKPDVVHSQCEFSSFYFAKRIASKLHIPLVHTYHTVYEDYTHYFSPSKRVGRNVAQVVSRTLCNHVDGVVVPTEKVKELLLSYKVTTEVAVIPSGIDLAQYQCDYPQTELDALKQQLDIPLEDKVLVMVGRMAKEKNHREIIEFVGQMNLQNVTLLLVGGGPYMEKLQEVASMQVNQDKIIFAGMIQPSDIGKYYQLGDIFVCASQSETQGITYIEALSSGLPCLCKQDECLDEVLYEGHNGFRYEGFQEFQEKLGLLLEDTVLVKEMGVKARQSVHRFSADQFARSAEQLYMRTMERRHWVTRE